MAGGKTVMKKIENSNKRNATFSNKRDDLFKKAKELSILCDAEVAVIIFSESGDLFEYSTRNMEQTLSRRMKGNDLDELGLEELKNLENKLSEKMLAVKNKKEQVLSEELEKSRLQEKKAMQENDTLRKQPEESENKRKVDFIEFQSLDRTIFIDILYLVSIFLRRITKFRILCS